MREKFAENGFHEQLWKFDSLALYRQFRSDQCVIVTRNRSLLVGNDISVARELLGKPFFILKSHGHLTYQYMLQNQFYCSGGFTARSSGFWQQHGLDCDRLSVVADEASKKIIEVKRSL